MKDVCQINEERLREFCKHLKVSKWKDDTYAKICKRIVNKRPDLFNADLFTKNKLNNWKKTIVTIGALTSLSLWIYFGECRTYTKSSTRCKSNFCDDIHPKHWRLHQCMNLLKTFH